MFGIHIGGCSCVCGGYNVICFTRADGNELWNIQTSGPDRSATAVLVASGDLLVGCDSAPNQDNGQLQKWTDISTSEPQRVWFSNRNGIAEENSCSGDGLKVASDDYIWALKGARVYRYDPDGVLQGRADASGTHVQTVDDGALVQVQIGTLPFGGNQNIRRYSPSLTALNTSSMGGGNILVSLPLISANGWFTYLSGGDGPIRLYDENANIVATYSGGSYLGGSNYLKGSCLAGEGEFLYFNYDSNFGAHQLINGLAKWPIDLASSAFWNNQDTRIWNNDTGITFQRIHLSDEDGHVYVTTGGTVIKRDSDDGSQTWFLTLGTSGSITRMILHPDGVAVIGSWVSDGVRYSVALLSPDGELLWQAQYDPAEAAFSSPVHLAYADNGDVIVCGNFVS